MDLVGEYQSKNVTVCIVKLKPQVKQMFFASGLLTLLGANNIFAKTLDAVTSIEKAGKFTHSSYQDSVRYDKPMSPTGVRLQRYDEKPKTTIQLSPPTKENTEEIVDNTTNNNNNNDNNSTIDYSPNPMEKQSLLGAINNDQPQSK